MQHQERIFYLSSSQATPVRSKEGPASETLEALLADGWTVVAIHPTSRTDHSAAYVILRSPDEDMD